jgi:DNA anti-recombination protein RmuC
MAATQNKSSLSGDGPNSWAEYRRLVLSELERVSAATTKCEIQVAANFLTLTQTINDVRQQLLEKIRETAERIDDEREKKTRELELDYNKKVRELETEYGKKIDEIRKDADKKLDETKKEIMLLGKDITTLKTKATVLGGIAGFLVALLGLVASIFLKK